MSDLTSVIQKLYKAEINVGLQANWDAGIDVWLGDDNNGRLAEQSFSVDELPARYTDGGVLTGLNTSLSCNR